MASDTSFEDDFNIKMILEQMPEGVMIARAPDGLPLLINRAGLELLGHVPEGLTVEQYDLHWSLEHADGRKVATAELPMVRALTGETVRAEEYRVILPGGIVRYALINAGPLRKPDGTIFAGAAIFADITARKQTEEALKESESRLRLALEASQTGIWDWDISSDTVTWNESIGNAAPISPGSSGATFTQVLDRVHPDDRQPVADSIAQALRNGGRYYNECRIVWPDGSIHWVAAKGEAYFGPSGNAERMIGVVSEITHRKRAEKIQAATYRISQAANSAESLQVLFRSIHGVVGELMPAENFYIALLDASSEMLSFPYFVDKHRTEVEPRKLCKGLTEYILRTGVPLHASPARLQELSEKGEAELVGVRPIDWLGVPLRAKEKTIGVLAVQSYNEGVAFGDEDVDVLVFVSAQVAMAIERKRAEEALRESQIRLELLNGISVAMTSGMSAGQLAELAVGQLSKYFPAFRVTCSTIGLDGRLAVAHSVAPNGAPEPGGNQGVLDAAPEYLLALRQGRTVVVDDVTRKETVAAQRGTIASSGARAFVDAPLRHSAELAGLLSFDSPEPRKWTDHEIATLVEIADWLAVAIKEARVEEENKKSEELLRQSEDRYRDLVEHTLDLMCTHDLDGFILSLNQGAARLFGAESSEIVGKNLRGLVAPEFRRDVKDYLKRIRADGVAEGTVAFVTASGERRVLEFHNTLRTEGVASPIVRGIAHDITERRRARDLMRISERKYKDVFELAPIGIYQSRHDGSLLTANSALARMLGYGSVDELLRVNLSQDVYLSQEQRELLIDKYEMIGSAWDLELQWRRKDGTPMWVNLNAHVVKNDEGQTAYFEGFVRDIDARKRTQDALRESEARFSKAFRASPDPISIVSLEDGRIIDANESFLRELEFSREEVIGHTSLELNIWVRPMERARIARILSEQGAVRDFETHFRKKSGGVLVGLISAEIIDIGGEPCVLVVTRDITERKRAEEERNALLASERAARNRAEQANRFSADLLIREQTSRSEAEAAHREWQTTFDTMTDAVTIVGPDDRLIRANNAFYRMIEATPEECLGRLVRDLVHRPGDKFGSAAECPICELRRKGERGVIELPEGVVSPYPVFASIDPVVDDKGERVAVIQVVRNLSDLYRARKEAERERTGLTAILEQVAEGMLLCDDKATLIHANLRAQQIFGISAAQISQFPNMLSLGVDRFTDEEGRPVDVEDMPMHTVLRERRPVGERKLYYRMPDGKKILLSLTASPFFTEANQLAGVIAFVRDVTEQQRRHERAQQADKLRALGQLASGVAHNFNNALAAVLGYTELALPKVRDPEVERYLRVVERSAKDAARMVERIQNFSRARSRMDEFTPVNLYEVISDAIDITQPRWRSDAEALSIDYDVNLDWRADKELAVSGEPSELREVFVNMILNALDAMPAGGRLDVAGSVGGASVRVTVIDTGTGMSDDVKQRVFDPFFTTKGVAGLGMGLSEGYRIVERHLGRIDVESQLGHGTTFTVLLPLLERTQSQAGPKATTAPVAKARILVIDDEKFVREVLEAILISRGHEVVTAPGAEEALKSIDMERFDVVFTDLAMPKTDGIAAAAAIRSRQPGVKIILMSGYGVERAFERAAASNAIDAAIAKPFKLAEIDEVLSQLLERSVGE